MLGTINFQFNYRYYLKENQIENSINLSRYVLLIDITINIQVNNSYELTVNSPTYYRDCQIPKCYYESFEIVVNENGSYVIWSESKIDTYGYLYKNDFDPLKPSDNLISENNGSCNHGQFKIIVNLDINIRYILVATTYHPYTMGHFSIFVSGSNNVSFNRFSKYFYSRDKSRI